MKPLNKCLCILFLSFLVYLLFVTILSDCYFMSSVLYYEKLISSLKASKPLTVLEQTVLEDAVRPIKEQIDSIIPGSFEFTSNGEFYIQDGLKLKVSNLATGSKMYSIIKILLEKGLLDSSTMLELYSMLRDMVSS